MFGKGHRADRTAVYFKSAVLRLARFLPDKPYVYIFHWVRTGQVLRLKNPQGYAQKIQWLKLNGRMERFAQYADKYTVRDYVKQTIGAEHLIPLIGVWDTFDEIPFDDLPDRFVLKVTDGCEYNYICKDRSTLDRTALKARIEAWQREDFYRLEREPQYKSSKSRIICEQYLEDNSGGLRDYKFHCSNGEPRFIQVDIDRFTDHKSGMRDLEWRRVDISPSLNFDDPDAEVPVPKPKNLDDLIKTARLLAAPFPYVRVDLYTVGSQVYFGELTFTPGSGTIIHKPDEAETTLGDLIDLDAYARPLAV